MESCRDCQAVHRLLGQNDSERSPGNQTAVFVWKDGYDVGTTGGVSEDVVRRYIKEKETETDH